jgi:drug/metabolite transporter (DMT)-like permease
LRFTKRNRMNQSAKVWASLFYLYIVWGTTYLSIQYLVGNIPPIFISGFRNFLAGIITFLIAIFTTKFVFPNNKTWLWSGLAGILMLTIGNGALTMALQYVPSGYASLFPAMVPVWLVLLQWMFDNKKPSFKVILGCLLGLVGVGLLVNLNLDGYDNFLKGAILLLIAAFSWSCGVMLSIKKSSADGVISVAAVQMLVAGAISLIISGLIGEFGMIQPEKFTTNFILAFLYLLIFAAVFGFLIFIWVSRKASPTLVATYNYVNPLVAITLGVLLNNEGFSVQFISAAVAIIIAVVLITMDRR